MDQQKESPISDNGCEDVNKLKALLLRVEDLHEKGVLNDSAYEAKKQELAARLQLASQSQTAEKEEIQSQSVEAQATSPKHQEEEIPIPEHQEESKGGKSMPKEPILTSNQEKPFKTTKSSGVIHFFAVIMILPGLFLIASNFLPNQLDDATKRLYLVYGISCIIVSALLFIISNLADDVHLLAYEVESLARQNGKYQQFMLSHLQEVDRDHDAIKNGIATISSKLK